MTGATVHLMYHELERAGRELCRTEPGYVRYVVAEDDFRRHLTRLRAKGWRGLSVGAALAAGAVTGIAITFDDGCETDLTIAAPLLKEAGAGATFYVVTGLLGQRGYLNEGQVRELAELGFEVGSHSHTHSFLSDLDDARLREEVAGSKERLEQILGRRVEHFSCPGGRWSPRVAGAAREAGYASVATSRPGTNGRGADPFCLKRVAVMRGTDEEAFERLCRAEGLLRRRTLDAVLSAAKRTLGNTAYEKLRSTVLGQN